MNPLKFLAGYRTYILGLALVAHALYLISTGDWEGVRGLLEHPALIELIGGGAVLTGRKAITDELRKAAGRGMVRLVPVILAAGLMTGCGWVGERYDRPCLEACAAKCVRECKKPVDAEGIAAVD